MNPIRPNALPQTDEEAAEERRITRYLQEYNWPVAGKYRGKKGWEYWLAPTPKSTVFTVIAKTRLLALQCIEQVILDEQTP